MLVREMCGTKVLLAKDGVGESFLLPQQGGKEVMKEKLQYEK